ncbi:hypothetical protein [Halalkalibaculum roseum]|nr:hypothetical protein [Halalkalibaculum roseum]
MTTDKSRSISFYILTALMLFQGLSGIYGGSALVLDPSGEMLGLPISLLEGTPFESYLIPGVILLLVLGLFPLVVAYGLAWGTSWAWTGAVLVSIALIIWIGVEIVLIGYQSEPPLQLFYGSLGIALLILTLLPSNQYDLN